MAASFVVGLDRLLMHSNVTCLSLGSVYLRVYICGQQKNPAGTRDQYQYNCNLLWI